ncbi:Type-1 restriction enzyme EcoKI specificity protein [Campylobacter jejuni]|nr:Type-1 restriction enzyme EcoKI specificity protein [Campylobacter jejuni]
MTNLPQGWEVKTLGSIGFFIRGVSYKKEQLLSIKDEKSVYLLRANNIQNELILDDLQIIPKELAVDKIIQNNDILFAMSSGSKHIVGKNILLNDLNDFTFGAFCGLFRINNLNISHKFLAFYLKSSFYKNYILNISKGSNINNLRFADLENLQIPLPPLKEQERIVGILDFAFSKIDENIKKAKENLANIDELMQSTLQKAFNPLNDNTKENYQLPQSWEWKSLDNIGEIITGTTPSKNNPNFYGNEYPLFKPSDLNGDMIIKYASDNLSKLGFDNARNIPKDTILVVCIGASIGKIGLSGVSGSCNQQINAIIPNSKFLPKFLFFLCLSNYFQEILKNNASQTTLPIINKTEFSKLQIPLPPLQEQEQIAEHLDFVFEKTKALKELYTKELKDYEELKQSLLDKAFKGEL